jgi:hypothetical protein
MSLTTEAVGRLAGQFQQSPKVKAMLEAIIGPLDTALADIDALKSERWIDSAIGKQLDGCGEIVGESRQERSDEEYREALRFRVFVNISNGVPKDLIRALDYIVGGDDQQYMEARSATAILFSNGADVPAGIQAQIQDLAPAGISSIPVCVSYAEKPFRFSRAVNNPVLSRQGGDRITANGLRIRVSANTNEQTGAGLAGIAHPCFTANGARLKIGGMKLRIHSPNFDVPFGSDFNLTGVYQ